MDSQAPGRWRSGAAVVLDLENTDVEAVMTVRGMDRLQFSPWGIEGGEPGSLARVIMNPDTGDERDIGKIDVLQFKRGDVVRLITPAGGGFGPAAQRDANAVARDVRRGLVSREQARSGYGVVVRDDLSVDEAETQVARASMPRREGRFSFCSARSLIDKVWPSEARAALAVAAFAYDPSVRSTLVRNTASQFLDRGITAMPDEIPKALAEENLRLQK
jgi:N-methylhydantoinase B